jgi:GNAT superfamily N-acetyltransferase
MSRFGVREAKLGDAEMIARAHTESWRASYRGILPDTVLDRIDVGQRIETRRRILRDRSIFQLVAYDLTHGDVVGFCDAGTPRRHMPYAGEIYAIYLVQHAKRHGLGQQMFERVQGYFAAGEHHLRTSSGSAARTGKAGPCDRTMVIWVLEHNVHARGFYVAMGGRAGPTIRSTVGGFAVTEVAYVWDRF